MYCFKRNQLGSLAALVTLHGREPGGGPAKYLFLPAAIGSNNQAIIVNCYISLPILQQSAPVLTREMRVISFYGMLNSAIEAS